MRILLTGANGQLGRCFQDRLPEGWEIYAAPSTELDITNGDKVLSVVSEFKPDVIVNAAAYTAVDKAENEPELATLVNVDGPENLAKAAKEHCARLIHVSTDYVFDGNSKTPYLESDPTNPLGCYGKSKRNGEVAIKKILPDAIIVRTAWVFSEYGNNFLKTMLRLGAERESLGIVADQYGCPTYAGDIATAIIQLTNLNPEGGVYHYCGDQPVSWYQFAEEIFSQTAYLNKLPRSPFLNPLTTEEYPTQALRPAYSILSTSKTGALGIQPSNWKVAVGYVIDKL